VARRRVLRQAATVLGLLLAALGLWQLGGAAWIHGKAVLAQALLNRAWAGTLSGAAVARPWPWADTYPVARLEVPALGVEQIVLAGASGRSLAFGPGHLDGTAAPGAPGHSVLSGHRDTHFRFLRDMTPGTELRLQRSDGGWHRYWVTGSQVVDARQARFSTGDGRRALTLVTCYPFDALEPGGPLRYLVFAEAEPPHPGTGGP
jgi:sortase A